MRREISFRVWTGKRMLYQERQYLASFIRRSVPRIIVDHDENAIYREHESYLPNGGSIDEYLMQYTGIVDKNDKKIYEDDIVRFKHENEYAIGQVVYGKHNGAFCFYLPSEGVRVPVLNFMSTLSLAATYDFEVLGNVHENPDLLEK